METLALEKIGTGYDWLDRLQAELGSFSIHPFCGLESLVTPLAAAMLDNCKGLSWELCRLLPRDEQEEFADLGFFAKFECDESFINVTSPVSGHTESFPPAAACLVINIYAFGWMIEKAASRDIDSEQVSKMIDNMDALKSRLYNWAGNATVPPESPGADFARRVFNMLD